MAGDSREATVVAIVTVTVADACGQIWWVWAWGACGLKDAQMWEEEGGGG